MGRFLSKSATERSSDALIKKMENWLADFVNVDPGNILSAHTWFLFSFYFEHDMEQALGIASACYDKTSDPTSLLLMVSLEEEFRGGIDDPLYNMLINSNKYFDRDNEVYLFYEAMYLKRKGKTYENLLLQAIDINNSFPHAYLELGNLYEDNSAIFNGHLDKSIEGMETNNFDLSGRSRIRYFFNEVVFLSQVSSYQIEYFKSRRK